MDDRPSLYEKVPAPRRLNIAQARITIMAARQPVPGAGLRSRLRTHIEWLPHYGGWDTTTAPISPFSPFCGSCPVALQSDVVRALASGRRRISGRNSVPSPGPGGGLIRPASIGGSSVTSSPYQPW